MILIHHNSDNFITIYIQGLNNQIRLLYILYTIILYVFTTSPFDSMRIKLVTDAICFVELPYEIHFQLVHLT